MSGTGVVRMMIQTGMNYWLKRAMTSGSDNAPSRSIEPPIQQFSFNSPATRTARMGRPLDAAVVRAVS